MVGTRVGDKVLTPHVVFCLSFCTPFSTRILDDTRLFILFSIAHTHSFHTQGVKRGDGGGRETEREDWRGSSTAGHSVGVWQPPHTRGEDKTRHGNGWTHKGKKDVGHTRGKGREKTRRGSPKDTHHTEKEKRQKDNEHHKTIKIIA